MIVKNSNNLPLTNDFKIGHKRLEFRNFKFNSESNLTRKKMNDSSPDFSTLSDGHESKYNMSNIDDTIFSSMKKKTLNDYDKELKSLKEENFNLKLRIYLLEEESGELNSKLKENKCMRRHASSIRLNSFSDEDDANCMDRRFSTSLSDMESTLINDDINNSKIKQRKKIDKKKLLNYYSSDDDQREIEIETLNNINLQLEEKIELLQNQLVEKEKHIEANRKENENLQENFEQFKLDCEREVFENLSEKFQKDLNDKLDDAYQKLYLKEQVFKAEIEKLQSALNEKSNEIELLKQKNNESLRNYKNTAVQQIESLMEQLIQKDNRIKLLEEKTLNCQPKEKSPECLKNENSLKTEFKALINSDKNVENSSLAPNHDSSFYSCVYLNIADYKNYKRDTKKINYRSHIRQKSYSFLDHNAS